MINIELHIDLVAEYRALDSDVEYIAENRPGRWNTELFIQLKLFIQNRIKTLKAECKALHSDLYDMTSLLFSGYRHVIIYIY